MVGFVKMVKAAPFKPSILHNASVAELVPGDLNVTLPDQNFSDSDNGWWSTPFGWEGYSSNFGEVFTQPVWHWHLQLIPGQLADIRNASNSPPFSLLDPDSWYLVPNIPVPSSAYQSGFPGNAPGDWPAQRMQWTGRAESGEVHIVVPEDTTVALFAQWTQGIYVPAYQGLDGSGFLSLENNPLNGDFREIYVLGPSFGQLVGYTQPNIRGSARTNAVYGWQS
jgi:hypothetical protein